MRVISGKITKNYQTEMCMVFFVDRAGREYMLKDSPLRKVWQRDLSKTLTAVELACGSFLVEAEYAIPEDLIGGSQIKAVYIKRQMGKPHVHHVVYIKLGGDNRLRLSREVFSVEVEGAYEVKDSVFDVKCLSLRAKIRPNILIRREK